MPQISNRCSYPYHSLSHLMNLLPTSLRKMGVIRKELPQAPRVRVHLGGDMEVEERQEGGVGENGWTRENGMAARHHYGCV